jgi:hypothetical protein
MNQSGICCMTTLLTLTCHDQSARPQLCVVVAGLRLTGMNDRTGGPDVRAPVVTVTSAEFRTNATFYFFFAMVTRAEILVPAVFHRIFQFA